MDSVCAVAWAVCDEAVPDFPNALSHGLDFRKDPEPERGRAYAAQFAWTHGFLMAAIAPIPIGTAQPGRQSDAAV